MEQDRLEKISNASLHTNWLNLPRLFCYALLTIAEILIDIHIELKRINK